MSGHTFINPVFKTKVLAYECLAWKTDDVWFKEYHLFASEYEIEEDLVYYKNSVNIRNVEVYEIIIDLTKPNVIPELPLRTCVGCGSIIDGDDKDKKTYNLQ